MAIASYGAAGLSGQSPSAVGWTGFRISLAGFLIPFTFIYNPDLLLVGGDYLSIALSTVTSLVGVIALAASLQNYLYVPMNVLQRLGMFVGSLLLIFPGAVTDAAGVALAAGVFLWQRSQRNAAGSGRGLPR